MFKIRKNTFETNSSSTHTLVVSKEPKIDYIPLAKHIKIQWIDTNDFLGLETLEEKLSYLISHLANKLKYSCNTYEELLEEITENYEYKNIEKYIKEKFDKDIRFPINKNGIYNDIEYIAEINHQLIPWNTSIVVEDVLDDLIEYMQDIKENRIKINIEELTFEQKLDIYFKDGNYILFGRD